MPASRLLFDSFEFQPAQRRLLRDGEPVALGTRAFDLLIALVERAGELVTKPELLDIVWPGLVVEENNIAAQIVALRKVLGGDLIETVPGRGYRFTAEIRDAQAVAPSTAAAPPAAAPATRTSTPVRVMSSLWPRTTAVVRIARAIAAADSRLPRAAVAGEFIRCRPITKPPAAAT